MTQNWSLLFFGLGSHVVTSKLQTHYVAVRDLESLILLFPLPRGSDYRYVPHI